MDDTMIGELQDTGILVDKEPNLEELDQLSEAFLAESPTAYAKAKAFLEEDPSIHARGIFPRNVYQYNGIKLAPYVTALLENDNPLPDPYNIGKFLPQKPYFMSFGGSIPIPMKGEAIPWTEEEIKAIAKLADENEPYAFHQKE